MLFSTTSRLVMHPYCRAVYGMARLRARDADLLSAVVAHSRGRLGEATPQALAGLALGLADAAVQPPEDWLQELHLHAYTRMAGYSAQVGAACIWHRTVRVS